MNVVVWSEMRHTALNGINATDAPLATQWLLVFVLDDRSPANTYLSINQFRFPFSGRDGGSLRFALATAREYRAMM